MSSKVSIPESTWHRGQREDPISPNSIKPTIHNVLQQSCRTHQDGPREGDSQTGLIPAHVQAVQSILGISWGGDTALGLLKSSSIPSKP